MTPNFILRGALLYLFIGISAFTNNNKIKHSSSDLRLIRMETTSRHSSSTVLLRYDQNGRITNVSTSLNSAPAQTIFNVSYMDSRIILARPTQQQVAYPDAPDEIILFLNASNRVFRKIAHHVHDIKSPSAPDQHQVSYLYDSTIYQYDVNGKLIMETITSQDSIWSDKGSTINKTMHVMNYSPVDARVGLLNHSSIKSTTTRDGAKVTTSESYVSSTYTFEYLNDYPFQTDFSNAAVLNELHPFTDLTVIGGYSFLPSSIRFVSTQVHNAGNVTRDTGSVSFKFSYDDIRMVSSMKSGILETRYVYGNPTPQIP